MTAGLSPRPAAMWRSTQLSARFSRPPSNQRGHCDALESSSTRRYGVNQWKPRSRDHRVPVPLRLRDRAPLQLGERRDAVRGHEAADAVRAGASGSGRQMISGFGRHRALMIRPMRSVPGRSSRTKPPNEPPTVHWQARPRSRYHRADMTSRDAHGHEHDSPHSHDHAHEHGHGHRRSRPPAQRAAVGRPAPRAGARVAPDREGPGGPGRARRADRHLRDEGRPAERRARGGQGLGRLRRSGARLARRTATAAIAELGYIGRQGEDMVVAREHAARCTTWSCARSARATRGPCSASRPSGTSPRPTGRARSSIRAACCARSGSTCPRTSRSACGTRPPSSAISSCPSARRGPRA